MFNLIIGAITILLFVFFIIKSIINDDKEVNKELEEIMDEAIKDTNLCLKTNNMKTFTEKEVEKLIRATINETAEGVFEWFKNETHIIDKKTKNSIDDISEIDVKEDKKSIITNYIYPRLEKHGIIINKNK